MKSRLGAPGFSLFRQEGAPPRGARKLPVRWGCVVYRFGAPRAGRLRTPRSWWPKPAVQEGGWGLVVKAMGGGVDGASRGRALTPGPSFAQAGAPRARQSPHDSAAGANSHCTKIGLNFGTAKESLGVYRIGTPRVGQSQPSGGPFRSKTLVDIWRPSGCGRPWLSWPRTGVIGLASV